MVEQGWLPNPLFCLLADSQQICWGAFRIYSDTARWMGYKATWTLPAKILKHKQSNKLLWSSFIFYFLVGGGRLLSPTRDNQTHLLLLHLDPRGHEWASSPITCLPWDQVVSAPHLALLLSFLLQPWPRLPSDSRSL